MSGRYSPFLRRRLGILLGGNIIWLLVILGFVGDLGPTFDALARQVGPVVLAGIGLSGIVWCGAIDLSVGSMIAVAGSVFGALISVEMPWLAFIAVLLTCVLLSSANAALVRLLKVPAIILTLGTLAFYRGLALILADVSVDGFSGSISVTDSAFRRPAYEWANGLVWGGVAIAIAWELCGKRTRLWLALGDSEEACRLQGIDPGRVLQSAFFIGGFFLGLGALVHLSQLGTIEPARVAQGFELAVIGAIVLGGTNIFGGEGSFLGTVLGALFLFLFRQVLVYAGVNLFYQDVCNGAAILIFVGVDCFLHKRRKLLEEIR